MNLRNKIKLFIENKSEDFCFQDCNFCGIESFLIYPKHLGVKWTKENLIFRSLICDKEGNPLSCGFPRFVNLGELPEVFPPPLNLNNCNVVEKLDGSAMLCSYHNNILNIRTRCTASYKQLDNYKDFEFVAQKYNIENLCKEFSEFTWLFEIVTPNQRIVLDYGDEPDAYLIGAIWKKDYSLLSQSELDLVANKLNLKRPKRYNFTDLDELVKYIKEAKDIEGVCIYSDQDTKIHKLKSEFYLAAHRMKSELGSINRVAEFYAQCGLVSEETFRMMLDNSFDFEVINRAKVDIEKVCEAIGKVRNLFVSICGVVTGLKIKNSDRKFQANYIINRFPEHKDIAFLLLDGKELSSKNIEKLMKSFLN